MKRFSRGWAIVPAPMLVVGLLSIGVTSCSSDDEHDHGLTATGAAVAGAEDEHCGANVVEVSQAACQGSADVDAGAGADPGYGPTMFNGEGDDDDCKYHVRWSATAGDTATASRPLALAPLHETTGGGSGAGGLLTFSVTLTTKKDGAPVSGAPIDVEAFLDETHPAPNTDQTSKETSTPGTYTVGPIAFDASGQWTVRFHFHDECLDSEPSPHGHAAFFLRVDVK